MKNSRSALFLGIFTLLAVGLILPACGGIDCDSFCNKLGQCAVETGQATQAQVDALMGTCMGICDEYGGDVSEDCVDACNIAPCSSYFACIAACDIDVDDWF